jgi:predicted AlkP superfamily pyrophosphatase or phosphodiesterase
LIDNGYYSFNQRVQMPAVSAPNWATILTGMPPSDTGIKDNDWSVKDTTPATITTEGIPPLSGAGRAPPSIPDILHGQKSFGAAYSWRWLEKLLPPSKMVVSCEYIDDDCVTSTVLDWISTNSFPDVSFVYFGQIDEMGHQYGWGSVEYYAAAKRVDVLIGTLLQALENAGLLDSLLIATTADHGGYMKEHGAFNEANMEAPVIYTVFGGRGTRKGLIPNPKSNLHFLPTCLAAVGVELPEYMWSPTSIFQTNNLRPADNPMVLVHSE